GGSATPCPWPPARPRPRRSCSPPSTATPPPSRARPPPSPPAGRTSPTSRSSCSPPSASPPPAPPCSAAVIPVLPIHRGAIPIHPGDHPPAPPAPPQRGRRGGGRFLGRLALVPAFVARGRGGPAGLRGAPAPGLA